MLDSSDVVAPTSTRDQLDVHYAEALQSICLARRDHDRHREAADTAEDGQRGFWQAQAELAMKEWTWALGAAQALEQLADALDIDLAYDRRVYGGW